MRDLESVGVCVEEIAKSRKLTVVDVLGHHLPKFTRKLDSSRSSSTNDEAQ